MSHSNELMTPPKKYSLQQVLFNSNSWIVFIDCPCFSGNTLFGGVIIVKVKKTSFFLFLKAELRQDVQHKALSTIIK